MKKMADIGFSSFGALRVGERRPRILPGDIGVPVTDPAYRVSCGVGNVPRRFTAIPA
jgi:hypothetical protein